MSGRLVILPKKTYCPWKRENVERVLRDERLDREVRENERTQVNQEESRARWRVLKGQQENENKHVNLFEKEEQKTTTKGMQNNTLGEVTRKRPFYLQPPTNEDEMGLSSKERKRKDSLDPMKEFAKYCSSESKRAKLSEPNSFSSQPQKRKTKDQKVSSRPQTNMDELRRRRREREEYEGHRVTSIVRVVTDDRISHRYQNQYNPGLSKKR